MSLFRLALAVSLLATACSSMAQGRPRGGGPPDGPPRDPPRQFNPQVKDPTLKKMMQASGRLRYSGVRVVEFRADGERLRNVEIVTVDGPRSRTEFGPGSTWIGQIIVENANQRKHFFPDRNEIHLLPRRRDELGARFGRMLHDVQNGRLQLKSEPGGDVAGHETRKISVVDPRGNVIQKLWIDIETGLPLKRELFDPSGVRSGYFEFNRVNYRPNFSDADFEINKRGAKVVTLDDQLEQVAKRIGLPAYRLPKDSPFKLDSIRPVPLGENQKGIAQVYVDGGFRLSLFVIPSAVDPNRIQRFGGDRFDAASKRLRGATVVLVGDIPRDRLTRLIESISSN